VVGGAVGLEDQLGLQVPAGPALGDPQR
jgi:hypothetical protein